MNTKNLEINQSNMMTVFASDKFFGSDDVFFRELLMNAYDACFTKQALQWSWGTEFLEEEQARQLNSARRSPYVPKIVISYDSSARLLSFIDNGIGMNEHDLVEYVGKLGESFYMSEEFKEQKLNYDPIARYGIGMCSCFMAARAVLIESKKDRAINTAWNIMNQQQLDGIMVKWFGDGRQIEYVNSNKTESGTKITLPLKPHVQKVMSMEYMKKAVEHYIFYPSIPITLICDGQRQTLYQSKMIWKNPFSQVLGITTIQFDNELMEGYIAIYNDQHKTMFGKSQLWQQNFRVVEDVDALDIKPRWLNNITFVINLKKHLLNLTMAKNGIIKDDMWMKFKEELGNIIVRYFDRSPMNLSQYIIDGREQMLSEFEQEADLLSRAVLIQVYIKEQEVEVPLRTVIHGYYGRSLRCAIMAREVFYFYKENYPHDFKAFISDYDVVIFEKNAHGFMQFLSPYITDMEYKIGVTPGVIYTDITADLKDVKNVTAFRKNLRFYPDGCKSNNVFCFVDNMRNTPFEVVFNPYNNNARILDRAMGSEPVNKLVAVITENIRQRVVGKKSHWDKIIEFDGTLIDNWKKEKPVTIESAWCLEADFPEKLNNYIHEKFSEVELKRYKISDLNFTKEDFISWWYKVR